MNAKLIGVVTGLLLLSSSGMALAGDDWENRGGHERHRYYDRGHDRHWDGRKWHGHSGYGHRPHSHRHYGPRHYHPRWHAPRRHYGHHGYHSGWGHGYHHDDGVTIIFKGRID